MILDFWKEEVGNGEAIFQMILVVVGGCEGWDFSPATLYFILLEE